MGHNRIYRAQKSLANKFTKRHKNKLSKVELSLAELQTKISTYIERFERILSNFENCEKYRSEMFETTNCEYECECEYENECVGCM